MFEKGLNIFDCFAKVFENVIFSIWAFKHYWWKMEACLRLTTVSEEQAPLCITPPWLTSILSPSTHPSVDPPTCLIPHTPYTIYIIPQRVADSVCVDRTPCGLRRQLNTETDCETCTYPMQCSIHVNASASWLIPYFSFPGGWVRSLCRSYTLWPKLTTRDR